MTTRARAAVLRELDAPFAIEEVQVSDPGPGEILVRIAGAGLCHTDLLCRTPTTTLPSGPVVLGHEGAGVVEMVGRGVDHIVAGDHVILSFDYCGCCGQCRAGSPSYCAEFWPRNFTGLGMTPQQPMSDGDGKALQSRWFGQSSFSTHAIATVHNAVKVDPEHDLTMLAPLGCGIQTGAGTILEGVRVPAGSHVAVFGAGAVGLSAVMAARVAGATKIAAVDLLESRCDLAAELGATCVFDGADPELGARLQGQFDCVVDTTGVAAMATVALGALAPRGRAVLVGTGLGAISIEPRALIGRSITYMMAGDVVPQLFIPRLIELWRQGRFPFDRLITTYPMHEINRAEQDVRAGRAVKPVLVPA